MGFATHAPSGVGEHGLKTRNAQRETARRRLPRHSLRVRWQTPENRRNVWARSLKNRTIAESRSIDLDETAEHERKNRFGFRRRFDRRSRPVMMIARPSIPAPSLEALPPPLEQGCPPRLSSRRRPPPRLSRARPGYVPDHVGPFLFSLSRARATAARRNARRARPSRACVA